MPVIFSFTIDAELAVVVREQVGLGAKVELTEDFAHPLVVLPHEVFAADLV